MPFPDHFPPFLRLDPDEETSAMKDMVQSHELAMKVFLQVVQEHAEAMEALKAKDQLTPQIQEEMSVHLQTRLQDVVRSHQEMMDRVLGEE